LGYRPLPARLEGLDLGWAQIQEAAVRALVDALPRSGLRALCLGAKLEDWPRLDIAGTFARARSWRKLETLDLSHAGLESAAVRSLLECPHLRQLRRLDLTGNDLTPEDVVRVASCPHLAGLVALGLGDVAQSEDSLAALARSTSLTGLVYLDLEGRGVRDDGVAILAGSANFRHLRVLKLPAALGDRALTAIAQSPHLGRLTVLAFEAFVEDLAAEQRTDAAALALVNTDNLPNLAVLRCYWYHTSEAAVRALWANPRLAWPGQPYHGAPAALQQACSKRYRGDPIKRDFDDECEEFFPWALRY
jgi:hypothetical protein